MELYFCGWLRANPPGGMMMFLVLAFFGLLCCTECIILYIFGYQDINLLFGIIVQEKETTMEGKKRHGCVTIYSLHVQNELSLID